MGEDFPLESRRRKIFDLRILIGSILTKGLLILSCLLVISAAGAQPIVRNLGTPVRAMSIRGSLLVRDPITGRPTFYSGMHTSSGSGRLIRFDYAKGDVEYYSLPGTSGAYGLTEGQDGKIYVGSIYDARIFSFDPENGNITDHGSAGGEEYIFELCTGPHGRIYGGTYPRAKVVMYDPANDEITDLGSMHPTEKYVGDLTVAENGRVFAGIFPHADLVVYDPITKKKRSILPERYQGAQGVDPDSEGNLVFASVDGTLLIIDANSYDIVKEIPPPEGGWIGTHRPMSGGPLLIHGLPGGYFRFNSTSRELEPFYTPKYSTYDNQTGVAYIRTGGRQIFQAHNLTSGELLSEVDVGRDGDGMMVFSLGTGPDGCIYGGSVSILHLFRYKPLTESLEDLGFPFPGGGGQFYSLHTTGQSIYMAAYSDSVLGVYEPSEEWDPGDGPDSNPRRIGTTGGEQNRPHALTSSADGRVFIGSEPAYGQYGGALSVYDPRTDSFEVHRNIIPNQTVLSLAASLDGWTIYGGSSTRGGTGTSPITDKPRFFAWDVKTEEKMLDMVPVGGAEDINSLVTAPDGRIYGGAGSALFVYDPGAGKIIHTQGSLEGEITSMVVGEDGLIYARAESAIFRMKPLSGPGEEVYCQLLHRGGKGRGLALDGQGRVYFGDGTELWVIDNIPATPKPISDLLVYGDDLGPGWTLTHSGAEINLESKEMVTDGRCQRVHVERYCTLEYLPPNPWDINLSGYDNLSFSLNPGNSTFRGLIISKTGPGSGSSVSLLEDYALQLPPNEWAKIEIPIEDLGWAFGSRMESLKMVVLGSGVFYLDSISLDIPSSGIFPMEIMLLGLVAIMRRVWK